VYAWGHGVACGRDTGDIVEPQPCQTRRHDFIEVAGGIYHSAALTGRQACFFQVT